MFFSKANMHHCEQVSENIDDAQDGVRLSVRSHSVGAWRSPLTGHMSHQQ